MSYKQVHMVSMQALPLQEAFKAYYDATVASKEDFVLGMESISKEFSVVLDMPEVKTEERAYEKVTNEKDGKCENVQDILRCSFITDTLIQEYKIVNFLNSPQNTTGWTIHEIRDSQCPIYINGFVPNFEYTEKVFPRLHRDLRVILKKKTDKEIIFSEIQMRLKDYETINEITHDLYVIERNLLSQSEETLITNEKLSEEILELRLKAIEINEAATEMYNWNALKNKETVFLKPGRRIFEDLAQSKEKDFQELVIERLAKGLDLRDEREEKLLRQFEKVVSKGEYIEHEPDIKGIIEKAQETLMPYQVFLEEYKLNQKAA